MIVTNRERGTVLGEAIEVAATAVQRVKGLLGRDCLEAGEGLLFKYASSMHTFFMQFPLDVIFMDKKGKVLKCAEGVRPFKLVASPFRAYYALELPAGAIGASHTKVGDHLELDYSQSLASIEDVDELEKAA